MKLPPSKVESACSIEESRYTLQAVKLDVEKKRMLATDGHILAVVPVEVSPEDHTGLISLDTMKALRDMQRSAKSVSVEVKVNSHITAEWQGQKIEHYPVTGQFPNCDAVIPKVEPQSTINLDIDLLMRLADAIKPRDTGKYKKARILRLHIIDKQSLVLVKANDTEAYGVIVSCRD